MNDKIKEQEETLVKLKNAYASAIISGKDTSQISKQIKTVTAELQANKNKLDELNKSYNELTEKKPEIVVEIDNRKGWQKFIDGLDNALGISSEKLDKWSKGTGKYISRIGEYFDTAMNTVMKFVDVFADAFDDQISQRIDELDKEIEELNNRTEAEINAKQESADGQLAVLNKMYDDMELSDQEYYDQRKALEQDLADFTNVKNAEAEAKEKQLLAEKDRLARKQFEAQQRNSIAQTIINGALAIIKGFADLGPIAGAINAGIQAGLTAAQLATIASQKYVPALAKGGIADGATLAMIGEAGKEAVIPLEKNTGWMETLAEKLSEIMQRDLLSGVQPFSPAYAVAGGATIVNNYYNQTINSPKALNRRELYRDSKNLLSLKG